jgi:sugar lactone lactonase YvrE
MIKLNHFRNLAARPRAGCLPGLFLLAGLLAVVTPLRADNPPTYLVEIYVSGEAYNLNFVALDSSNDVYVTEYSSRAEKLTAGGLYLTQWGSLGTNNGQFDDAQGVAVDRSNNVYVADYKNGRIEKFDSNGNYLTQWGSFGSGNGQFEYPEGIAVDSSKNVYVADAGNNRVQKFSGGGTYLMQWGSLGENNGQFNGPVGIAMDNSNNVYVADNGNFRVEKFDSNGNYLKQWGSQGNGNGQFYGPEAIAVDGSNNVYVTDFGNFRVEKFDSNGNYLTQWGSDGQFEYPNGIAVDNSGNFIYVVDWVNARIEIFVNNANIVPPIMTQQPANQTVPAGINVTFSVGVIGTAPFAFQWTSNNVAVPGATNATLTLTNVNLSASGNYSVLVTNSFGGELSGNAVLTVLPVLVTTQPASGLSATSAVLNGSVTVGLDETVVWFDWGTDTNYGNIAGAAIVPSNDESTNISDLLGGLPGNFYHYRIDAANDFGIVYGQDQLLTVGFAPSATTLPPTNGANGATLQAAVNPEGWDTTVYFQWETPTLTNTTPGIDIGAGATSVNVGSFVPGLAPFPPYQYQVVASNALATAIGAVAYGDPNQHRYLFSGSRRNFGTETNITLNPGAYIITAYGAPGGGGGLGAEMSAEFNFSASTNLTLLVGEGGGYRIGNGSGGGGGSFVVQGSTPLVIAGGGGGYGGGNGSVSTNGGNGYGFPYGGSGGTAGGGGTGGIGYGSVGIDEGYDYIYGNGGGGGGGFLGGGSGGTGDDELNDELNGGFSFEAGGEGGQVDINSAGSVGGFGGGGGSTTYNYENFGSYLYYFYYGGGGGGGYSGGGGGGYYSNGPGGPSNGGGGGGGGSIIDSSAIAIFAEVSGIASPDDPNNGEIIITPVPTSVAITIGVAFGFTNGVFGFNVIGQSGASVVIQASTDLQTWIPLQTNLLGNGLLYFSDAQSPANTRRFYRAQLSP